MLTLLKFFFHSPTCDECRGGPSVLQANKAAFMYASRPCINNFRNSLNFAQGAGRFNPLSHGQNTTTKQLNPLWVLLSTTYNYFDRRLGKIHGHILGYNSCIAKTEVHYMVLSSSASIHSVRRRPYSPFQCCLTVGWIVSAPDLKKSYRPHLHGQQSLLLHKKRESRFLPHKRGWKI